MIESRGGGVKRTVANGYGARHKKLREHYRRPVATGTVRCARCGGLIAPGEPFDLGHDDFDRSRYAGPEHVKCNRATAGRRAAPPPVRRQSGVW